MEKAVKNKKSSQRNTQIKVVTSWQHTQEPNLSFKRLMMLLLKPREKRRVNRDEQRNDQ